MDSSTQGDLWRDQGRKWVYGKDISSWPRQKLSRAIKHKGDLEAQYAQWWSGYPITTEKVISDDRLRWQTKLRVFNPPPVAGWSLALGDCVHSLRSALDAFVWDIAHIDGLNPPRPHRLQYPIVRNRSQWAKARAEQLQTVPDDVADRIERMQPFNRDPAEVDRDALVCISHLDNLDKHRSSILLGLILDTVNMNMTVRWEDPAAGTRNVPPNVVGYRSDIVDGAVVMELTSRDPIAEVVGGASVTLLPQVETPTGYQNPFQLLPDLINYVQSVLNGLAGGLERVEDGRSSGDSAEGWVSMDIQQEGNAFRLVQPPG